jgi:hypothetical protein
VGFKVLTPTNYTERDEANDASGRINESGQVGPVAGADRARAFLAIELAAGW